MRSTGVTRGARAIARAVPWLDLVLLALALLIAAVTLGYPFGRDQGLYHYVGREWLRGRLPYRDAMDQKSPLIYLVFGAASALFGDRVWGIRALEGAFVAATGWVAGALARPRGAPRVAGLRGAGAVLTALCYFGPLDYWHTAQCEVYCAGLLVLAWWCIEHGAPGWRGAAWAGVAAGCALLAKPPAAVGLVALAAPLLEPVARARYGRGPVHPALARALGFAAGAAAPVLLVVAYFALAGGLADFVDILVHCNRYYVEHESEVRSPAAGAAKLLEFARAHFPLSALALLPVLAALALRRRRPARAARHRNVALLLAAAVAAVAVQLKFYPYHWGVVLCLLPLGVLHVADDAARAAGPRLLGGRAGAAAVAVAACIALAVAPWWLAPPAGARFARVVEATRAYRAGRIGRRRYHVALAPDLAARRYDPAVDEALGRWLRAHTRPGEWVLVRGFDAAAYLYAERAAPTRFFWSPWLAWTSRAYRRTEWSAQDRAALRRAPPRYIATLTRGEAPAEAVASFVPDYAPVHVIDEFTVLERIADTPPFRSPWLRPE